MTSVAQSFKGRVDKRTHGCMMNCCVCYTLGVVLFAATCGLAIPVSEDVDQVPPLPQTVPKDDGSADLKPPPPPPPPVNDNRFSGTSAISAEASAYDPSPYPGLVPAGIPPYPDPFPGGYPAPYPGPIGYGPAPGYPTPYVVQTGYEGYLVPAPAPPAAAISDPLAFLRGVVPRTLVNWMMRSVTLIVGTMTVVFMGGAITTALCTLTPFCSISFKSLSLFNLNESAKNVGKMLGNEITPERVRRAATFVRTAIKKYSELQSALNEED